MTAPASHPILNRSFSLAAFAAALAMGGCAQGPTPQQQARHSKEYFPSSIYGAASPRVIADGEPVPKGGGQYLVGHAYTVAGKTYVPSERKFAATGLASWYGDAFHGRRTANGEIYDREAVSAAHPTMPLPSYARVTNLRNHRSIIVRVNDRGPYHSGRMMDLSAKAAEALEYKHIGTAKVKVEYVGRAALSGSDDRKLLATLRLDGQPAQLDDFAFSETRMAEQRDLPRSQPLSRPDRATELVALAQPESVTEEQPIQQAAPLPPSRPVAAAEAPVPVSDRLALAELSASAAILPKNPPLPPQRPFDLGTIPGADTPIAVARR
jgi:rare lipoprotein A